MRQRYSTIIWYLSARLLLAAVISAITIGRLRRLSSERAAQRRFWAHVHCSVVALRTVVDQPVNRPNR